MKSMSEKRLEFGWFLPTAGDTTAYGVSSAQIPPSLELFDKADVPVAAPAPEDAPPDEASLADPDPAWLPEPVDAVCCAWPCVVPACVVPACVVPAWVVPFCVELRVVRKACAAALDPIA